VRLGGLVEVITEMGIADPSVRVLTSDSVNLVAVTALLAVELEAAGEAFHLKHVSLNLVPRWFLRSGLSNCGSEPSCKLYIILRFVKLIKLCF
jgi:hypothetical protein